MGGKHCSRMRYMETASQVSSDVSVGLQMGWKGRQRGLSMRPSIAAARWRKRRSHPQHGTSAPAGRRALDKMRDILIRHRGEDYAVEVWRDEQMV